MGYFGVRLLTSVNLGVEFGEEDVNKLVNLKLGKTAELKKNKIEIWS